MSDLINLGVAIAIFAMMGHFAMQYLVDRSGSSRLSRDIAAVNEAVYLFRVSGGDLSRARSPEEVIAAMQSVEEDPLTSRVSAILREMAIDPVYQSPAEARRRAERAFWDAERLRFEISDTGPRGIKTFRQRDRDFDSSPPPEEGDS